MTNQSKFQQRDWVIVKSDRHPGFKGADGGILKGNDEAGYDVGFTDILAPDEFPVHILHYPVEEIEFANQPEIPNGVYVVWRRGE